MTEVREITFKSLILARVVRISSWIPSAKNAFSLLSLRFSNGRTAIDLSSLRAEARGKINKPARAEISRPAPSKMRRLRRPRRCGEARLGGGVARMPCGVTSKAQAKLKL